MFFSESYNIPNDLDVNELKSKIIDGLVIIAAKMPSIEAEQKGINIIIKHD